MGDYTTLYIGGEEFFFWKWDTPKEPFLDFVFQPSDKEIRKLSDPLENLNDPAISESFREEQRQRYPLFECFYITTVKAAEERLDSLGFSTTSIEEAVSELAGIPAEDVEYILRGERGYHSPYLQSVGDEEEWEATQATVDKYIRNAKRAPLGYLAPLWKIRKELDCHIETAEVKLDPNPVIGRKDSPEEFGDIKIIQNSFSESIRLDLAYLASARAHFSTHQFHLVYIELATALESAIKTFIRSRCKDLGVPGSSKKLFRKMSLLDTLKVATRILGDIEIDEDTLKMVKRTYDKRNNVIHQGARRFTMQETARAIEATETVIERLSQAN